MCVLVNGCVCVCVSVERFIIGSREHLLSSSADQHLAISLALHRQLRLQLLQNGVHKVHGNGGTLDADVVLEDGQRRVDRHLVVRLVTVRQAEVVVQ